MKRLTILFMLFLTSCMLYAKDRKGNDLSGPIALKGELTEKYQNYTKGTPVVIRGVRKMRISPDETAGITYAVEIDGLQYPVGAEEAGKIIRLKPATVLEYWQGVYLSQGMYDYYNRKGYRYKMRQELDEECLDYLDKLNEIAYKDAYIQDYVQAIFAKVNPGEIDTNRPERLNVRIIQSRRTRCLYATQRGHASKHRTSLYHRFGRRTGSYYRQRNGSFHPRSSGG